MSYAEFLDYLQRAGGLDRDAAERAATATLQTLGERISREEAQDLVGELPPELGAMLFAPGPAQRMDVDEFVRRVAQRSHVDERQAERLARLVFMGLSRVLSDEEWEDMAAQLPTAYAERLLPRGPEVEVVPHDVLLTGVAERGGFDVDTARQATEAVLEVLAERIAPGEVDDLLKRLPEELHPALLQGKEHGTGQARRLPPDDFVQRVALREQVDGLAARAHVRAVLSTLHEALGDADFSDVVSQLGPGYDPYWARPF